MSKKLIALCMAIAAFAVWAGAPASAWAENSPELTSEGLRVPTNTNIRAHLVNHADMTLPSGGKVTCTFAEMTGTVTKNNGSEVEGNITSAHFTGEESEGRCESPLGAVRVTTNPTTNGLPWCIRSTPEMTTDEFRVRGGSCSEASRPIRFTLDVAGLSCSYESSSVSGTFATEPEDAVLTISEQSFSRAAGGFLCPGSGKLDMAFTLETDVPGTSPLYIS